MNCEHCGMPEDRHLSDCPVRVAVKAQRLSGAQGRLIRDLERWRNDQDARLIINATCARYEVPNLAGLDEEVLRDLHEAIEVMMEESPPIDEPFDPRRTM